MLSMNVIRHSKTRLLCWQTRLLCWQNEAQLHTQFLYMGVAQNWGTFLGVPIMREATLGSHYTGRLAEGLRQRAEWGGFACQSVVLPQRSLYQTGQ